MEQRRIDRDVRIRRVFGDGELDRTSMQIDRLCADDNHDT
jgi:hypothetical protein